MSPSAVEAVRQCLEPAQTSDAFRRATLHLASGVFLVTYGEGAARNGVIATSVASLSADPPTLLVALPRTIASSRDFRVGGRFGVSVLAAGQAEVADRFAARSGLDGEDRFAEGEWLRTRGGACVSADAAAIFECETDEVIVRHGRPLVIGRVLFSAAGTPCGALVAWRGGYDQVGWSADEVCRATGSTPRPSAAFPALRVVGA